MQRHLIALDLDGTLLKDHVTVSERTLKTLNAVRELGHIVVIATGRPYRLSRQIYSKLDLDTPIVNMNGAFVHHPKIKGWSHRHSPLPKNVALDIIEASYGIGVNNMMAEIIDKVYLDQNNDSPITQYFLGGLEDSQQAIVGNLTKNLKDDPTSMLIHSSNDKVDKIDKEIANRHASIVDHREWGAPFHIIEVMRSGMNKAVGLQLIADEYSIPTERIIAFGDENNDLEMIEYAGVGVAMGNGIDQLKNIAKEITLPNTKDGVAHFLEHYFNLPTPNLN